MSEIDFIRAERDALQIRVDEYQALCRKLVYKPLFCRGVDSYIREYDGQLIRQQQGCEDADLSRVLQAKRQAVREILEGLTCRDDVAKCFSGNSDDLTEWQAKYFPSDDRDRQPDEPETPKGSDQLTEE